MLCLNIPGITYDSINYDLINMIPAKTDNFRSTFDYKDLKDISVCLLVRFHANINIDSKLNEFKKYFNNNDFNQISEPPIGIYLIDNLTLGNVIEIINDNEFQNINDKLNYSWELSNIV